MSTSSFFGIAVKFSSLKLVLGSGTIFKMAGSILLNFLLSGVDSGFWWLSQNSSQDFGIDIYSIFVTTGKIL